MDKFLDVLYLELVRARENWNSPEDWKKLEEIYNNVVKELEIRKE